MARCCGSGENEALVAAAAALSIYIAKGKTAEQMERLSALFEILGDNLALLALNGGCGGQDPQS